MAGPKTTGTRVQYGETGGAKTKNMHVGGGEKSDLTVSTSKEKAQGRQTSGYAGKGKGK